MAWSATFDAGGLEEIESRLDDAQFLRALQGVLENEAPEAIKDKIKPLLPASGRTWRGKKKAASLANPFKHENEMLAVTVKTVPRYGYLYFPDDGSNTKRHAGLQDFMGRGAEAAAPEILDTVLGKLEF